MEVGGRLSQGSEMSCSRVHPSWSLGNQWAQSLQPAAGSGAASLVWTGSKSDDSPLCPATSTRDRVNRGHSKEAQFKRTKGFHMGGGSNPRMHFRFSGPLQPAWQPSIMKALCPRVSYRDYHNSALLRDMCCPGTPKSLLGASQQRNRRLL